MNIFIRKILLFFLLVGAILTSLGFITLQVIAPQYSLGYNAAIIDKVEKLKNTTSPKIILVGNSSLAFGIDSPYMEKELGYPVVNTGLYGGLKNEFAENVAKENIQPGDIVVISYITYSNDSIISNPGIAWMTIENHYELWHLIDKKNYENMLKAFPKYILKCFRMYLTHAGNADSGDAYSRIQFNENGDNIFDRPETQLSEDYFAGADMPEIDEDSIKRINAFNQYCLDHGATLVIAAMPIADGIYTAPKSDYESFEKELRDKLDAPVISNFTDYFIPYKYFFDTEYHMTNDGVRIRTGLLIKDLQKYLNNNN